MKEFFLHVLKLGIGVVGLFLVGCATPFHSRSDRGLSPESTLLRRDLPPANNLPPECVLADPLRPEEEEEEETEEFEEEPEENEIEGAEYTVRKGDCLSRIAREFHLALDDLLEANQLDKDAKLFVGQKLILPGILQEEVDQLVSQSSEYIIQKGDCLSTIARRYGITIQELKAANGLSSNRIIAGKKLMIPEKGRYANVAPKVVEPEKPVIDAQGYYTVKKGDSLSKISNQLKVSVRELQSLNDIADPGKIQPGQKILVKRPSVPTTPTSSAPTNSTINPLPSTPANTTPSTPKTVETKKGTYDFVNDEDFFGRVDDIPVVEVED